MRDRFIIDNKGLDVRPLEPRDLTRALEMFPEAIRHLHPVSSAGDRDPSSVPEKFFNRQSAWVAEMQEQVIGMAVLSIENQLMAHLAYLQVADDDPHLASMALAEVVIRKAWDAGCLKLVVHAHIPTIDRIEYMHELGFQFTRTHSSGDEKEESVRHSDRC